MKAGRANIAFHAAPPRGRLLSMVLIVISAAFVGLAYLLHCDGLICRPPPDGSNALAVLFILSALSLVIAWFVRPSMRPVADLVIADSHLVVSASGLGLVEGERTVAFADISGFRLQPGLNSRGLLIVDLAPTETRRAPYVAIPLDGLGGSADQVFRSIESSLADAGYRIDGARFRPTAFLFQKSWTVSRDD